MSMRLKKSIKALNHADALKKARQRVATQKGTSYKVDKVEFTVERKGVKYYRVYLK